MIKLRYGNTYTFFINGLLVDTDCAGMLTEFYKALKENGVRLDQIKYVLATHFHPDHMGLIGDLTERGVKLLLIDVQKDAVHASDYIFERDKAEYTSIDETQAAVISCRESRSFLERLGIAGEIISTPSHSADSVSLVLDEGDCFVGDLEPFEYIEAYDDNSHQKAQLEEDWRRILSYRPKRVFYAHRPESIRRYD